MTNPDSDGITSFTFDYDGAAFGVRIAFSGGGSPGPWTWDSFNPQPDPTR